MFKLILLSDSVTAPGSYDQSPPCLGPEKYLPADINIVERAIIHGVQQEKQKKTKGKSLDPNLMEPSYFK